MKGGLKPWLLLDVDGVLNVVGPDYKDRLVRLPGDGHPFHPTPFVLPFMTWAWENMNVVWCTAWRESANQIADWARLPRMPAITEPEAYRRREKRMASRKRQPTAEEWLRDRGDWKVEGACEILGRRHEAVFWVEDGLTPEGHAWVGARPRTWYLAADSFEGVTPSHARIMAALAGLTLAGL